MSRVLSVGRYRSTALFLLGFVMGMAALWLLGARWIEDLERERQTLTYYLQEYRLEVARLREGTGGGRIPIQAVQIQIGDGPEDYLALQIKAAARPYIEPLIGRDVSGLSPELAYRTLDGREVVVRDRSYLLHVRAMVLAPETWILVDVELLRRPPPGGG